MVLGIVLYRVILDVAYAKIIAYHFDYQFFYNNKSLLSVGLSWLILLFLMPMILRVFQTHTLSSNIISVLIIVSLVPTTTMIAYNSMYALEYVSLIFIYWLLLLLAQLFMPSVLLTRETKWQSDLWSKSLTIILSLTVVYISWYYTGFRFHFGLMDVYDVRAEAREYDVPFFLGYLSTFSDNLLPILLVYYMSKKSWYISSFIVLIIFLNFGITATKQILFLLFLAITGYYFIKSLKFSKYFIWLFSILSLVCLVEYYLFSTYAISIFSLYRVMFIPAKLHYVYFEFFSKNELDYFRQSALKWLLESPYKENIGFVMGYQDIGQWSARANNGLFTDAYMNFGAIGVFYFPLILIFIVKLIEGAAKGLNERIFFIITSSVSFVLLGIPFTTALFSSGLLLIIIFLSFLPRNEVVKA
jgi:hypothetical protein